MTLTQERPGYVTDLTDVGRNSGSSHASSSHPGSSQWRDLLESRWRDRLHELTELCVTFHEAGMPHEATQAHPSLRRLMRRAVAARQALAETDAALRRLTGGTFGRCEDCSGEIPALRLLTLPELRFCARCASY
jgi:RNA polymerase-binding transcription factor DksA